MAVARLFSDETGELIKKEYESGATLKVLSEKYEVGKSTIYRTVQRHGGVLRSRAAHPARISVDQRAELRKKYEAGASLRELAAEYGVDHTTVQRHIVNAGGVMRERGYPKGRSRRP